MRDNGRLISYAINENRRWRNLEPKNPALVGVLDITRRTVEAFDKNIGDLRKLYLGVVASLTAASAAFVTEFAGVSGRVSYMMYWLGTAIVGFVVLMWLLELRYRNYLRISSSVARSIEAEMLENPRLGISLELERCKQVSCEKPLGKLLHDLPYQLLYILPGFGAITVISVTANNGGYLFDHPFYPWSVILYAFFGIVTLLMAALSNEGPSCLWKRLVLKT